MPSQSPAQAKFMRAVAHNDVFAHKVGVPQSIGREFYAADKRKALANGLRKPYKPATGGVRG